MHSSFLNLGTLFSVNIFKSFYNIWKSQYLNKCYLFWIEITMFLCDEKQRLEMKKGYLATALDLCQHLEIPPMNSKVFGPVEF